jgi:uncharacterized protein (DUF4415 family)
MSNNVEAKEVHIEVTEEEYRAALANGGDEESLLKPGRHIFRRVDPSRVAKSEDRDPRNSRVGTTVHIDLDTLNYLKEQAALPGAPTMEEQINRVLREFMEQSKATAEAARLLNDASFIAAVAERVKDHLSKRE